MKCFIALPLLKKKILWIREDIYNLTKSEIQILGDDLWVQLHVGGTFHYLLVMIMCLTKLNSLLWMLQVHWLWLLSWRSSTSYWQGKDGHIEWYDSLVGYHMKWLKWNDVWNGVNCNQVLWWLVAFDENEIFIKASCESISTAQRYSSIGAEIGTNLKADGLVHLMSTVQKMVALHCGCCLCAPHWLTGKRVHLKRKRCLAGNLPSQLSHTTFPSRVIPPFPVESYLLSQSSHTSFPSRVIPPFPVESYLLSSSVIPPFQFSHTSFPSRVIPPFPVESYCLS